MRTPVKIAAFGGALALSFGGALGVGAAIGDPLGATADGHGAGHTNAGTIRTDGPGGQETAGHGAAPGDDAEAGTALPGGLMVSQDGFTLDLIEDTLPAGANTPLAFQVLGANGEPVTGYAESHERDMHLITVRRDLTEFQHVHPELAGDGTWSVPVDLTAGSWRVFADFVPADADASAEAMTLGADLAVAGDYDPRPLPAPSATAEVDDYTITLDGELAPGQESELTLSVRRDGQPVTDLQPYLAAYGHLIALRDGDLAYLHVHPAGEPGDGATEPGPGITFYATTPSAGDYRLFLDFQHDGVVRTAEFTARAEPAQTATPPDDAASEHAGEHATDDH